MNEMRKILLHRFSCLSVTLMALLSISSGLKAQVDTLQNPKQFLFPGFSRGTVAMKDGKEIILRMNYNIASEKMAFIQDGKLFEMKNQESVDTVYLAFRKFVPVGKVFYEVGPQSHISMFIQHRCTIQSPPQEGPYGTKSEVSSSVSLTSIEVNNNVYKLTGNQKMIIKPREVYWIRINDSFSSFETEKQLINILPDLGDQIKQYIRQNKTKFTDPDSIVKLIVYCNSLKK
jgi:hypothetical protein